MSSESCEWMLFWNYAGLGQWELARAAARPSVVARLGELLRRHRRVLDAPELRGVRVLASPAVPSLAHLEWLLGALAAPTHESALARAARRDKSLELLRALVLLEVGGPFARALSRTVPRRLAEPLADQLLQLASEPSLLAAFCLARPLAGRWALEALVRTFGDRELVAALLEEVVAREQGTAVAGAALSAVSCYVSALLRRRLCSEAVALARLRRLAARLPAPPPREAVSVALRDWLRCAEARDVLLAAGGLDRALPREAQARVDVHFLAAALDRCLRTALAPAPATPKAGSRAAAARAALGARLDGLPALRALAALLCVARMSGRPARQQSLLQQLVPEAALPSPRRTRAARSLLLEGVRERLLLLRLSALLSGVPEAEDGESSEAGADVDADVDADLNDAADPDTDGGPVAALRTRVLTTLVLPRPARVAAVLAEHPEALACAASAPFAQLRALVETAQGSWVLALHRQEVETLLCARIALDFALALRTALRAADPPQSLLDDAAARAAAVKPVSLRLRLCEVLLTLLRAEVLIAAPPEARHGAVVATLAEGLRGVVGAALASCCAEIETDTASEPATAERDRRLLRDLASQVLDLSARLWAARRLVSFFGEEQFLLAASGPRELAPAPGESAHEATTAAPSRQTDEQQRQHAGFSVLLLRPSHYARLALDHGRFQLAEAIVVVFGLGGGAVAVCRAAARMHGLAGDTAPGSWQGSEPGPLAAVDRALLLGLAPFGGAAPAERQHGEHAVVAAMRARLAELHAECRASGRDARQLLTSALTVYEAVHLREWSAEGSKAPALDPDGGGGPRALQQQLERLLEQLARPGQSQGLGAPRVSYLAALGRHLQTAEGALASAGAELGATRHSLRPAVCDALARLIVPLPDEAAALAKAWGLDLRRVAASAFHKALEMGVAQLAALDALAVFERKYLPPGPLWGVPGRASGELVAPFAALATMALHAPSPGPEQDAYYAALMARAAALAGRAWDDGDNHPVARFRALQQPSSSASASASATTADAASAREPSRQRPSQGQAPDPATDADAQDGDQGTGPDSDPAAEASPPAEPPSAAAGEPLARPATPSPPRPSEREPRRGGHAGAAVVSMLSETALPAPPPAVGDAAADQLLRAAGLSAGQAAELSPLLASAFDELPASERVLRVARLRRDLRARARDPSRAAHAVGLLQALDFSDAWRAALRRGREAGSTVPSPTT